MTCTCVEPKSKQTELQRVVLLRQSTSDTGTEGVIMAKDGKSWFVLELPWRDNQRNISCIPEGTYRVKWTKSFRLRKYTYQIMDVPQRGGIRIHAGNVAGKSPYKTHSRGCPLMGKRRGWLGGQKAVLVSRVAVQQFVEHMGKKTFLLEIKNDY